MFTRIGTAFPTPQFLSMPGAGIDISGNSVKVAAFKTFIGPCLLDSFTQSELPQGTVVDGDIEKPDALVDILRSLRLRSRIRFAHASLPERKAYLYQTLVPKDAIGNLKTAVEFSLESHVPIPPHEAVFDFEVARRLEQGVVVSVTAYARRVVEAYADVFRRAGITLRSLEIESQALGRALWSAKDKQHAAMVVDFGKKTTRIAIFDRGTVGLTATVDVGGNALTSAAMKRFGVSEEEAEKMKNERGFLEGAANRELYEAMAITASVLKDEIAKYLSYWSAPPPADAEVPRTAVEEIVLVGGNANILGLPEHLARFFKIPVRVGDVWTNAAPLSEHIPPMPQRRSLEFATAVGLALRSCNCRVW